MATAEKTTQKASDAPTGAADLDAYCLEVAQRARAASTPLATLPGAVKDRFLRRGAALLRDRQAAIMAANALDLAAAPSFGLSPAQIDRLRLSPASIESMARGMEEVAAQAEPIGQLIESTIRPNGLEVQKIRVPLGVVFFIYE
ncbi:MAG TPA: hypothetical protein VGJ26_05935 [Pirellulales bacterium]